VNATGPENGRAYASDPRRRWRRDGRALSRRIAVADRGRTCAG